MMAWIKVLAMWGEKVEDFTHTHTHMHPDTHKQLKINKVWCLDYRMSGRKGYWEGRVILRLRKCLMRCCRNRFKEGKNMVFLALSFPVIGFSKSFLNI